ncbi:tripartite tricarboxylate transporter substrate binding protein [Aureimonas fodinaquatilis]|uniref:Tripartite tricarboxylate transporter substrate binding protein n=1 Tax=Aureimonas fodinaquatilis TaxID=2565783 RepID=A0A5B0DW18_9HYPH|nr:tripartite tricarboxylate transporter substrate binding protein [Aureimonas fodinaquatilis]KAA0969770.1 tripartite tricarboxylate transporter substrate binding protein [Aureimonas fodinaquatilis]
MTFATRLSSLLLALGLMGGVAVAQDFPSQPVKFVVPFNAGGGTDVTGRIVADEMTKILGKPVLVENRPGAQGIPGTRYIVDAAPDGYTIGFVLQATMALNPGLYLATNYDPIKDLAPVSQISESPYVIVVHPSLGVENLDGLIALAKADPGKVNYASGAAASHLASLLFQQAVDIEMQHIPYSGSGQAITDLLSGRVGVMLSSPVSVLPHIEAGTLVPIAVTGIERSASLPDVPTVAESGYDGFEVSGWYGISAPAGTPDAVVAKLNEAVVQALANPAIRESLQAAGVDPKSSTPEEFAAFIAAENERWTKLIQDNGIKAE